MRALLITLLFVCLRGFSQEDSLLPSIGDKAPPFIMNLKENTIQSITMPYMKKIVLLSFWSTNIPSSILLNVHLNQLAGKYRNASYKNAENFEVIAIAVQTDKRLWNEGIKTYLLDNLTHGIAIRGFNDAVCKKYGVTGLPTSFLIDESGIIIAINPRIIEIENILDERKNFQPIRKDITGILAQSSDINEALKFSKLFLFNSYGDSITSTVTGEKGQFLLNDVKLNQDFVLKIDNKTDINTTDPIALYSPAGEFMMDGRTQDEGFIFKISSRYSNKLVTEDSITGTGNAPEEIDIIKSLIFNEDGSRLTVKDELELRTILQRLQKNPSLSLEFITHTDARMTASEALELTSRQAEALRTFFQKKGIAPSRLKAIAKGNTELRKLCEGMTDCRDEDHRLNRRVEFLLYKD